MASAVGLCSSPLQSLSCYGKSTARLNSSDRGVALSFISGGGENRWRSRQSLTTHSAAGGIPSELAEDSKFVPLNADDPVYGPPVLLLSGFRADETEKIKSFLKEMDGEFLKIIRCTEDMLSQSLWDAVHTAERNLKDMKISASLPRMCILSGLSGEEMMMFIDAFPDIGLEPAVFAALVPNSAGKLLGEVMEEIMGDHEMLVNL